jgi:hypothetical protein
MNNYTYNKYKIINKKIYQQKYFPKKKIIKIKNKKN